MADVEDAINRWQARAGPFPVERAEKRSLEEERLVHGFSSLAPKEKPVTRIRCVERRGMMVRQLVDVAECLESIADANGEIPGWVDMRTGEQLYYRMVNLYHICEYTIIPMTRTAECSFVELIAEDAALQRPYWFVSHWWGEPVHDFATCVKGHAGVRALGPDMCYWVCAYANNQHELGQDVGADPLQSSFFKAMCICNGVLLILDEACTPFKRIWCCFEESVAVTSMHTQRSKPLLLDVATVSGEASRVITEGLTDAEKHMEALHKKLPARPSGWDFKSKREASFPIDMVRTGLKVSIAEAEASIESDRIGILNTLAGRELNGPVDLDHPVYKTLDNLLRATFAAAFWREATRRRKNLSDDGDFPLSAVLRGDTARKELTVHLGGCSGLRDEDVRLLACSLPPNLERLALNFDACSELSTMDGLGDGISKLRSLNHFTLELCGCKRLSSTGTLWSGLASLQGLQSFELCLMDCVGLKSIAGVEEGLGGHTALTNLHLNFNQCYNLESFESIGHGLARLSAVQSFTLHLTNCDRLRTIKELGLGFGSLVELRYLDLNLNGCVSLSNVKEVGKSLGAMVSLKTLQLNFMNCCRLSSVHYIGIGLAELTNLEVFRLYMGGCKQLGNIGELGKGFSRLSGLKSLTLDFGDCGHLSSVDELGQGLSGLKGLEALWLDLSGCIGLRDVVRLVEGCSELAGLLQLTLLFCRCSGLVSVGNLVENLSEIQELQLLAIDLADCSEVQDVGDLGDLAAALRSRLPTLKSLTLNDRGAQQGRWGA